MEEQRRSAANIGSAGDRAASAMRGTSPSPPPQAFNEAYHHYSGVEEEEGDVEGGSPVPPPHSKPPVSLVAVQVADRLRWWRSHRLRELPLPTDHHIFGGSYANYSSFGTRPLSPALSRLLRQAKKLQEQYHQEQRQRTMRQLRSGSPLHHSGQRGGSVEGATEDGELTHHEARDMILDNKKLTSSDFHSGEVPSYLANEEVGSGRAPPERHAAATPDPAVEQQQVQAVRLLSLYRQRSFSAPSRFNHTVAKLPSRHGRFHGVARTTVSQCSDGAGMGPSGSVVVLHHPPRLVLYHKGMDLKAAVATARASIDDMTALSEVINGSAEIFTLSALPLSGFEQQFYRQQLHASSPSLTPMEPSAAHASSPTTTEPPASPLRSSFDGIPTVNATVTTGEAAATQRSCRAPVGLASPRRQRSRHFGHARGCLRAASLPVLPRAWRSNSLFASASRRCRGGRHAVSEVPLAATTTTSPAVGPGLGRRRPPPPPPLPPHPSLLSMDLLTPSASAQSGHLCSRVDDLQGTYVFHPVVDAIGEGAFSKVFAALPILRGSAGMRQFTAAPHDSVGGSPLVAEGAVAQPTKVSAVPVVALKVIPRKAAGALPAGSTVAATREDGDGATDAAENAQSSVRRELVEIEREVSILRRLRHSGCSQFYEAIRTPDAFVIAMRMNRGSMDTRRFLSLYGPLTECRTALILFQLLSTIHYLHLQFHIIHRDIKLENLLLSEVDASISDAQIAAVVGATPYKDGSRTEEGNRCSSTPSPPPFDPNTASLRAVDERAAPASALERLSAATMSHQVGRMLRATLIDFGLARRTGGSQRPRSTRKAHQTAAQGGALSPSLSLTSPMNIPTPSTASLPHHLPPLQQTSPHSPGYGAPPRPLLRSSLSGVAAGVAVRSGADILQCPSRPGMPSPLPSTANMFTKYLDVEELEEEEMVSPRTNDSCAASTDVSASETDTEDASGAESDDDDSSRDEGQRSRDRAEASGPITAALTPHSNSFIPMLSVPVAPALPSNTSADGNHLPSRTPRQEDTAASAVGRETASGVATPRSTMASCHGSIPVSSGNPPPSPRQRCTTAGVVGPSRHRCLPENHSMPTTAAVDDAEAVLLLTPCGTEKYLPPEVVQWILQHGWSRRSTTVALARAMDLYAAGIVAYVLLSGCFPFNATSRATLLLQQQRVPRCTSQRWAGVSDNAISFVQRLLEPNPKLRMTAREALAHPFLTAARELAVKLSLVPVGEPLTAEPVDVSERAGRCMSTASPAHSATPVGGGQGVGHSPFHSSHPQLRSHTTADRHTGSSGPSQQSGGAEAGRHTAAASLCLRHDLHHSPSSSFVAEEAFLTSVVNSSHSQSNLNSGGGAPSQELPPVPTGGASTGTAEPILLTPHGSPTVAPQCSISDVVDTNPAAAGWSSAPSGQGIPTAVSLLDREGDYGDSLLSEEASDGGTGGGVATPMANSTSPPQDSSRGAGERAARDAAAPFLPLPLLSSSPAGRPVAVSAPPGSNSTAAEENHEDLFESLYKNIMSSD